MPDMLGINTFSCLIGILKMVRVQKKSATQIEIDR
jgi:hypothetical protein